MKRQVSAFGMAAALVATGMAAPSAYAADQSGAAASSAQVVSQARKATSKKTVAVSKAKLRKFVTASKKQGSAQLGKGNFRLTSAEQTKISKALKKPRGLQASVAQTGSRFKLRVASGNARATVTSLPGVGELRSFFNGGGGMPSFADFMKMVGGQGKLLEFGNPGMSGWMGTNQGALESMNATLMVAFGKQLGLPQSLINAVNSGDENAIKAEMDKCAREQASKLGLSPDIVDQIEQAAANNDFDTMGNLLMQVMQAVMAKAGISLNLTGLGMPTSGFPPLDPSQFPSLPGGGFPGFGGTTPPFGGGGMPPMPPMPPMP